MAKVSKENWSDFRWILANLFNKDHKLDGRGLDGDLIKPEFYECLKADIRHATHGKTPKDFSEMVKALKEEFNVDGTGAGDAFASHLADHATEGNKEEGHS